MSTMPPTGTRTSLKRVTVMGLGRFGGGAGVTAEMRKAGLEAQQAGQDRHDPGARAQLEEGARTRAQAAQQAANPPRTYAPLTSHEVRLPRVSR